MVKSASMIIILITLVLMFGCAPPKNPCAPEQEKLRQFSQEYNKLGDAYKNLYVRQQALLEHYYWHMEKEHPVPKKREL